MATTRARLQSRLISMSTAVQATTAYHGYRTRMLPEDLSGTAEALIQQGYEQGYLDAVQAVQRTLAETGADDDEPPRGLQPVGRILNDPDRIWCVARYEYVGMGTCMSNCGAPESRAVCWGPGR